MVHLLMCICLPLLFITSSISQPITIHSPNHFHLDKRTPHRNHHGTRGSGRRASGGGDGRSRTGRGSSNCDPLYAYLFGTCGQWPFSRTSPNNPFLSRPPRRPPPLPPPVVPSPPPPPPPSPPPLVPSPPPPDPTPPLVLSPPPDYILPPIVPELPPDNPFQAPPWFQIPFLPPVTDPNPPSPYVPISFSPPADDNNPPGSVLLPPPVPIFSPPQLDPGQLPQFPPVTDPGQQFPPVIDPGQQFPPVNNPGQQFSPVIDPGQQFPPVTDPGQQFPPVIDPGQQFPPVIDPGQQFPPQLPFTFTPPVESTTPLPGTGIIMPPPMDEKPVSGQPFFSTQETPEVHMERPATFMIDSPPLA